MYPRLSDIFQDVFGFSLPLPIYSFGFMVAVSVMMAAWLLQKELDRKYRTGSMGSVRVPDPEGRKGARLVDASPSVLVGTITMVAVFSGFAGAKLFHILENLDQFAQAPLAMIFSTGGFTFYGGLVVAMLVTSHYLRKKGVSVGSVSDAVAPGLMLAYGVGRIGCHLAGDGDWGIAANLAAKPDWLPMWLWAETYPNNILGIDLSAAPVYPTPIYELVMALALFGVLWSLRKHSHRAGWLFWFYVVLAGVERFFIEKIRVNNEFDVLGVTMTQAEVISVLLVVGGLIGVWKFWKPESKPTPTAPPAQT